MLIFDFFSARDGEYRGTCDGDDKDHATANFLAILEESGVIHEPSDYIVLQVQGTDSDALVDNGLPITPNAGDTVEGLLRDYVLQDECVCADAELAEGTCLYCKAERVLRENVRGVES